LAFGVADVGEGYVAYFFVVDRADQIDVALDGFAVDLDDDVTCFEAGT
jgi:hypothetical protein